MADSCCIVELKESIQKLNDELSQSRTKIFELEAKVREQEEENTRLARDLKECEEKCRATQKRLKFAEQKFAQFSHKPQTAAQIRRNPISDSSSSCSDGPDSDKDRRNPISDSSSSCSDGPDSDDSPTHVRQPQIRRNLINDGSSSCSDGSNSDEDRRNPTSDSSSSCSDGPDSDDSPTHVRHPQVNETKDDALDINSMPNEIILKIFSYLTQNQLGQIARLSRRWNVLAKSPVLWRKVNVKIFSSVREKSGVTKSFINGLPSCVTSIRLDFQGFVFFRMDFEELCVKLHQNCPHVENINLTNLRMSNLLPEVINFCTQFLQCIKKLVFHYCHFPNHSRTVELNDNSKIEVLDLCCCDLKHFNRIQFSKLLYLKDLRLSFTIVDDTWFVDDAYFLNQLEVLDLRRTHITASTFLAIQNHSHNLKELYLCNFYLEADDLNFNKSAFPQLKTICLSLTPVTCEGVVSLIQSCPSLQNVYVIKHVARSFAEHPFVLANRCKSEIVKVIRPVHLHDIDCLHT